MSNEELIGQIYTWLEKRGERDSIQVLVDLPNVEWVEVYDMKDRGEYLALTYRGTSLSAYARGETEMLFRRSAITAVRKREKSDVEQWLRPSEAQPA